METKINIAAILKDKPEGTKLWTDMFGSVTLYVVTEACDSFQVKHHNKEPWFDKEGKLCKEGVLCIYPSKSMRDWFKFAWKKGDVLVHKDGDVYIIFEGFADDTYCSFVGKYYLWKDNNNTEQFYEKERLLTSDFQKAGKDAAQTYINTIEERLGGKFNRETLEVEKPQPEFKDGDIVMSDSGTIVLVRGISLTRKIYYHAFMRNEDIYINQVEGEFFSRISRIKRFATDSEKQQLFKALANEGKAWDAEKKMIVDLKSLWTPKPFDKVLVRNSDVDKWLAGFFEKFEKSWNNPYHIMNLHHMTDFAFKQCIPYEGNESLLGTTKDVEG